MKKRFRLLITLPVLLIGAGLLFFLSLPYLVDLYLLPRLLVDLPFSEKELSLAKISPWQIQGSLNLANEDRSTRSCSIPRFEIHYTPGSLLQRKFTEVLIDSASLQVDIRNGRPVIHGLTDHQPAARLEDNTSKLLLPLAVDRLRLRNCSITLAGDLKKPFTIIVDGRFNLGFTEQPEKMKLFTNLAGKIETRGNLQARTEIGIKAQGNGYQLQLHVQTADLDWLGSLVTEIKETDLSGQLAINLGVDINQSLSSITGYQATVKLPGFRLRDKRLSVENDSADKPITLQLAGSPDRMQYTLTNLIVTEPERSALDLQGELDLKEETFSGSGRLLPARTESAVKINYSGSHGKLASRISYQLAGDAFSLQDNLLVKPFTVEGEAEIAGAGVAGSVQGHFPEIALKKTKTKLINLSLRLPFQYPPLEAKSAAGELKIEQIRYQGANSGSFRASLLPTPKGLNYTTMFTSPFIPGLKLSCEGLATPDADVSGNCRLPETSFKSSSFPPFVKLPKDLSLSGRLEAGGQFQLRHNTFTGNLNLNIRNGSMSDGKNTLSDIVMNLSFPHLPLLQSGPGQLCTIGSMDLGKLRLSQAKIHFRIEDQQSIFLESIRANWCGGKVETGSFTLSGTMQKLETTLYCDRLGFTELLSQFGIDKTEGQGSLNGRLPVQISKQGVVFDDGFLFSTPGNSGIVRFNDTTQLRRGIPGINNSAYLDYSMKALENFAYNWTKLSFNSQNDDLLITMQLDGKPATPLPFGYNNGRIVPSDQGPGLQHPIRLDVNFRIPMQALLQYGKNIQSIMEKM